MRYRNVRLAELRRIAVTIFRNRPWMVAPMLAANITLLALSGYPGNRVGIVAVCHGLSLVVQLFVAYWLERSSRVEDITFAFSFFIMVMQGIAMGATGGLTSPFAPILMIVCISNLVSFGRGTRSLATITLVSLITLALAFLPEELSTLEVPYPYNITLTAIVLFTSFLVFGSNVLALTDAFEEAGETMERMSNDLLVQARARSSSLESLSSELAHELKNPLAAIKGLTTLLAGKAENAKTKERLEVIVSEVSRMEVIMRDYLSFSKPLEVIDPAPVELGGLLDDVVSVLEARAANAQVTLARQPGAATVVGDRRRLKEALLNLVANAIEATPPGGWVHVSAEPMNSGARLLVRDTGLGMSREDLARVGTKFFTTRPEGTGLGVLLARTVARQHGGDLTYESELGRGTRATLSLPSHPPVEPG